MRAALCWTLAAASLASVAAQSTRALSFQVEPKVEECLYEEVKAGSTVDAQLMVLRGGKLDVRFRVEGPDKATLFDQLIFSNVNDKTGQISNTISKKGYRFTALVDGGYAFCFDNRMSRWTAKVVSFELDVIPAGAEKPEEGAPKDESAVSSVKNAVGRLQGRLNKMVSQQIYHRQREARHRNTVESTNSRVAWFTVLEAVSLIAVSLGQLYVVKTWFKTGDRGILGSGGGGGGGGGRMGP